MPCLSAMNKRVAAVAASLLLAGCASGRPVDAPPSVPSSGTLKIVAASSVKNPLAQLTAAYTSDHPGVKFDVTYADPAAAAGALSSSDADLFATGEPATMEKALGAGTVTGATFYAWNQLWLVVKPYNPDKINGLNQSMEGKKFVVCAPSLPCGADFQVLMKYTDTDAKPASQESSVTAILEKVATGEADAGIVFGPDAKPYGNRLSAVWLPNSDNAAVQVKYPIARTSNTKQVALADNFIDYCVGEDAKKLLKRLGFNPI